MFLDSLPSTINDPHPHLGIGDLLSVLRRFDHTIQEETIAPFQLELFDIQSKIAPDEATFMTTSATIIEKQLGRLAAQELERTDSRVGVVVLDRYTPVNAQEDIFKLEVSRDINNRQITRPGAVHRPDDQYHLLAKWAARKELNEIIVMDDVLGTGSTLIPTLNRIKHDLSDRRIRAITAIATTGGKVWSGIEKVEQATGITTEYTTLLKASEETLTSTGLSICNSRDMTVLGGYLTAKANGFRLSVPHFLPYTVTVPKNITSPQKRFAAAEHLLDFNDRFIDLLETRADHHLTLQDISDRGFGVPSTIIDAMRKYLPIPRPSTPIKEYLKDTKDVFTRHRSELTYLANAMRQ